MQPYLKMKPDANENYVLNEIIVVLILSTVNEELRAVEESKVKAAKDGFALTSSPS